MSKHDIASARLQQEDLILALDQLDQAVQVATAISQRIRKGVLAGNSDQAELPFSDEAPIQRVH